jgi:hypothetical protein
MTLRRNKFLAVTFPVSILLYPRQLLTDSRSLFSNLFDDYPIAVSSGVTDTEGVFSTEGSFIPSRPR